MLLQVSVCQGRFAGLLQHVHILAYLPSLQSITLYIGSQFILIRQIKILFFNLNHSGLATNNFNSKI